MEEGSRDEFGDLPPSDARRIDAVCMRFEAEWRAGRTPRIEDYLAEMEGPQRETLFRKLLALELELREAGGERPDPREYDERFGDRIGWLDTTFAELLLLNSALAESATRNTPPNTGLTADPPTDSLVVPGGEPTVGKASETGGPDEPAWGERIRYFGDYELTGEIGRGGMGVVYRAWQRSLGRAVALKMIRAGELAGPADVRRFRNEAQAAACLDHPNIVPIHEVGEHDGQHYFCMKLIEGGNLAHHVHALLKNPRGAARLMSVVARAANHAHQRGILHRDLKPSNILIDAASQPHLTDFGLARRIAAVSDLTPSDAVLGTPSYMPPEQARGSARDLTPTSDVYSLGAILYELLTGRPPFKGDSALATVRQVLEKEPERPRSIDRRIDVDLETIALKCLEKEPARRYGTAEALAEDLDHWLAGEPIVARPVGPLERGLRWCKRNPVVAVLGSAVAGLLLTMAIMAVALNGRIIGQQPGRVGGKIERPQATLLAETPRGRLAVVVSNPRTKVEIGGGGDVTTLIGTGTHELSRRVGSYRLDVIHDGTSEVKTVDIAHDVRAEFRVGHDGDEEPIEPTGSQDEIRDYRKPILTVETGGHHGGVRSLLWQDGSTLLSGGEDKVVRVWDFQSGGRLARSIRPPIWRGPAGMIYAMALTRPDGQGQSFLAVGGYGVESRRGDLTIFRVPGLERSPAGAGRNPTGEIVARLLSPPENQPEQIGHRNSVLCLAFDPTGRVLASGSSDRTAILWDVPTFRPRAFLRGHTREIRALSFSPDGLRLATAGGDGSVRLWDVAKGTQVVLRQENLQQPVGINTLAFSPDGGSLVIGRETGDLFQFDARNTSEAHPIRLPTIEDRGPVECLTFSPDGKHLVVSIMSNKSDRLDAMALTCDLEMRAMPEGNVIRRWQVPGIIHDLSFGPRGDRLAYSAGPSQSIFIQDTTKLELPPHELKGKGSTPFDLGFTADSQVVGFTRDRFDPANPPATYEAFHLSRRKSMNVSRNQLHHAIMEFGGWSLVGSVRSYRLEAVHLDGRRWQFDLSPSTERIWWSHTMIPPGPKHERPTVAVGCETGVVVYDLETGRRTRVYAGHSSPVVSLVPSPDGRWLASSSIDQTIMLYPLADSNARLGFGAKFQRQDQAWVVARVEPDGFAASMGLRVGDVFLRAGIARGQTPPTYYTPETIAGFVVLVDELRPGLDTIAVWVKRGSRVIPPFATVRRDQPALSLFIGTDRDWVLWTPQGFFDSSAGGDQKHLGWHVNADFRSTRSPDFFPAIRFESHFRRPEVVSEVLRTGDRVRVEASLERSGPRIGPEPHRLAVLAVGVSTFVGLEIPPIRFADRDARDFANLLLRVGGQFGFDQITTRVLVGDDATMEKASDALADLAEERSEQGPRPGDAVVVFLETRLRESDKGLLLLGTDSTGESMSAASTTATRVGNILQRIVQQGRQVLVFLDLRHESDPEGLDRSLANWIRDLYRAGIVVLLGSQDKPGLRLDGHGHGAFAEGVIATLKKAAEDKTLRDSSIPSLTLERLEVLLQQQVLSLTGDRQQPICQAGDLPADTPVFEPTALERRSSARSRERD